MQIKILCLEEKRLDAVSYWRVYMPLMVMRKLFPGVFEIEYKKTNLQFDDIANSDIIIMTRPEDEQLLDFVKNAKADGIGLRFILDLDDDVLDIPACHSLSALFDHKRKKIIKRAMDMADVLWTSTPRLAEKYGGICIPNAIIPEMLPNSPAPDRNRLMWRGHSIQNHDLELAGRQQFERLKKQVDYWAWIGYQPLFKGWEKSIPLPETDELRKNVYSAKKILGETPVVVYPNVRHTSAYLRMIRQEQFNYVWKPLYEHGFNEAKSNIALIEATIGGGVCITNFAGRPMWENATPEWINYDKSVQLWEKAKKQISTEFNLLEMARRRAKSIFQVLGYNTNPAENDTTH